MKLPELLIPAGSLEKLKVAVQYGADALYLGGQKFGLRTAADNFTYQELEEGVEFAHNRGVHIYIVLNSFLHDEDLEELPEFLLFLESLKVDALIVSDLGVIKTIKKHSSLPIHLSTQASCLNSYSGLLWKKMGVQRLILGREVSLNEALEIKKKTGLEVELFIHGSMCMAYSGNCTISNYTQGRDSNRGGCAHSCRFLYSLNKGNKGNKEDKEDKRESKKGYFMSSKDLRGLGLLEKFIELGIDSIKVEGRMKSILYAATVAKTYREALDSYKEKKEITREKLAFWEEELEKFPHRDYSMGSLKERAGAESIFHEREGQRSLYSIAGHIVKVSKGWAIVEVKNTFSQGMSLEYLPFRGSPRLLKLKEILNLKGEALSKTKPATFVKIPSLQGMEKGAVLRMGLKS